MTDAQSTTGAPAPNQKRHIMWKVSVHKTFLVLSWLAPFIILGVGGLFPALRQQVGWPWNAPSGVWAGIVVQLALMVIWLIYEFWYTAHRNAAVYDLQSDGAVDMLIWGLLMFLLGGQVCAGILKWYFLVPLLGQTIDTLQALLMGINNAAEKPYVPTKGST